LKEIERDGLWNGRVPAFLIDLNAPPFEAGKQEVAFIEVLIEFGSDAVLLLEGFRTTVVSIEVEVSLVDFEVCAHAELMIVLSQDFPHGVVVDAC
jgi:hypothetical protein